MKRFSQLMVLFGLLVSANFVLAEETVKESATGKMFAKQITFSHNGTDFTLSITGATVRKKAIFKVYGIAHYMQDPAKGSAADCLKAVLADDKAKQITMDFARGVEAKKIQDAYRDGFKKNATPEEMKEIQSMVDQFITSFDGADVKENEQYVLRWLPGGIVIAIVKGVEKPAITNAKFARILWSIWLGDKSIVDQNKLVELVAAK